MGSEDNRSIRRIVRSMARGEAVDWKGIEVQSPEWRAAVEGLETLEKIAQVTRSETPAPEEPRSKPEARQAPASAVSRRNDGSPRSEEGSATDDAAGGDPASGCGATIGHWGPLQLCERIGAGSYGEVFRAYDPGLQIDVALKLWLPRWSSSSSVKPFLREARTLAKIRHPNVLAVHGVATHDGRVGMWSELLHGQTLEACLAQQGPFGAGGAAMIGAELCRALAAVHQVGLVHRDVKTHNVMQIRGGGIVLMDFGSVTDLGTGADEDPFAAGTPLTMAPEQMLGGQVESRADLYALGVLLYRLVTGRYPIEGSSLEQLRALHRARERTPLRDRRPDLPIEFIQVVERCLAHDPIARFASAGTCEQALMGFIGTISGRSRGAFSRTRGSAGVESGKHRRRQNLPAPLTSFVGRERVLEECLELLRRHRLLSLVGPGGCGKTRLGLQVAERWLGESTGEVWFVDLAPLRDGSYVERALARTLRLRDGGRPLDEVIIEHLRDRSGLLLMDNCEHVVEASAGLVRRLLEAAGGWRVLATSREAIHVAGERTFLVPPLSVPGPDRRATAATIETYESVRLFVERVKLRIPSFQLADNQATSVAEICRRLDGIPLAIELAAGRMKLLSVEQICAKLDDRFRLLTGGSESLPRHQTLRATLQWSYDHLADDEQRLFRQLSVFAGGWTLEAATAVAGEGADEFEVLDLLTHLADKSLTVVDQGWGEPRHRMLETVHQFARERLNESGDAGAARTRHLDYYLALAEEAEPKLIGPAQGRWLRRLDAELENILAAHAWCDHSETGNEKGLRLMGAVRALWLFLGLFALGLRVTREALRRDGAESPTRGRALALYSAAGLARYQGEVSEARALAQECVSIFRALGEPTDTARALMRLGYSVAGQGNQARAREHLEEAIEIGGQSGDQKLLGDALNALGELLRTQGDLETASAVYEHVITLRREQKYPDGLTIGLLNLAMIEISKDALTTARGRLAEALSIAQETVSKVGAQLALDVASALAVRQGDMLIAARFNGAAEALLEWMGTRRELPDREFLTPQIARTRAELGEAVFEGAHAAGRRLSHQQALGEAWEWLERSDSDAAGGAHRRWKRLDGTPGSG